MSQFSYPWEFETPGDAGPYSSDQWARAWKTLFHGALAAQYDIGVLLRSGNGLNAALQVAVTSPATNQVRVFPGAALVQGRYYESDDTELVTITANSDPDDRIDRIVLRIVFADQTIRIERLQGTPAASPTAPSLTQTGSIWEIPLAQILVPSGFLTITTGITDERQPSILPTTMGGTGFSSLLTPYTKGDLLVALSAEVLTNLAVGATAGMRLVVDSSQAAGMKWIDPRPSIAVNDSSSAEVNSTHANMVFSTITADAADNINTIDGSGYLKPQAGTYRLWASLNFRTTAAGASGVVQASLYDNNAAAIKQDILGNNILSNAVNVLTGVNSYGTITFDGYVVTFTGNELLSFQSVSNLNTAQTLIRRAKNPVLTLERLY